MHGKMKLTDSSNYRENWHDALSLWSRVVNWTHYNTSEKALKQEIKQLLLSMWNEKDWLKKEFPAKGRNIEKYVNNSNYIKVVADLANTIKHRELGNKPRSNAKQTDYYGKITFINIQNRTMCYIEIEPGKVVEIFQILRGALYEYDA